MYILDRYLDPSGMSCDVCSCGLECTRFGLEVELLVASARLIPKHDHVGRT